MFGRRKRSFVNLVWRSYHSRLRSALKKLLSDPEKRGKFGESYLHAISERIETHEQRKMKLWITNAGIIFFLAIQVVTAKTNFSFLGVSIADLKYVREVFLTLSVTIGIVIAAMQSAIVELKLVRSEITETLYSEEFERKLILISLPSYFGDSVGKLNSKIDSLILSNWAFLIGLPVFAGVIAIVLAAFIPVTVQGIVAYQIFVSPQLPAPWNMIIVAWTVLGMIGVAGITLANLIPLPFRDWSLVDELRRLREKGDMVAYEKRREEILVDTKN